MLRLLFVVAVATSFACADDELHGFGDPAIEVRTPDGASHLDADPSLELQFDSNGQPNPVVQDLEIISLGEITLELLAFCIVRAPNAAAAKAEATCEQGGTPPYSFPDLRGPLPGGQSAQLPITYTPLDPGARGVFLRIGSNAQNDPVVVIELGATTITWPPEDCSAEAITTAEQLTLPSDILWVIDSSGSMSEENDIVQDNLNTFSADITASGIDHHVIVIGDSDDISVPPPLGGSSRFLHVDDHVDSDEALQMVLDHYPDYQSFLRPTSTKHIVAVSDDNSGLSANAFTTALSNLTDPGFQPDWVFHSIVAYGDTPLIGCATSTSWGAAIGTEYLDLSAATGGTTFPICEPDWTPVFDDIEASVVVESYLPCELELPEPPVGKTLDTAIMAVVYAVPGFPPQQLPRVADAASCGPDGWYLDDPVSPTQVLLCAASCDELRSSGDGWLEVVVGCH